MANKKGTRPTSGSEEMKGRYKQGFGQANKAPETSGSIPPTEEARLREARRLPGGNGRVDEMMAKNPQFSGKAQGSEGPTQYSGRVPHLGIASGVESVPGNRSSMGAIDTNPRVVPGQPPAPTPVGPPGQVPPGSSGSGEPSPGPAPRPDAGVPQGAIVNNWNPKDPAWVAKTEAKFGPGTVQKVQQAMNAAVAGIPDDGSGRRRVAIYNILKQFGMIPGAPDENPTGQGGVPGMGPAGGGSGTPNLPPVMADPYTQVLGGVGSPQPMAGTNPLPTLAPPPGQQPNVSPVNPYSFFSPF